MNMLPRLLPLALATTSLSFSSCATIVGTAVSPITGGVDLCREALRPNEWYWIPFVFVGGAIAGPFVAFYNGVNYDPSVFKGFSSYWYGFDDIFRPFKMVMDPGGPRRG
jgi:hypothetical protein